MASQQETVTLMTAILVELGYATPDNTFGPDTPVSDAKLDSLSMLEFLMLVDEQTGVEIATEDLTTELTLGGLADLINQKSA